MHIDCHCHLIPEDCMNLHATTADGEEAGIRIERDADGKDHIVADGRRNDNAEIGQFYDVSRRLREMDTAGVDVQAISVPPFLTFYGAEAGVAAGFAQRLNDGIAAVVHDQPTRFVGLATVPLQDTDLAIAELERAVNQLGMRGVEIISNVAGENLDSPRLFPFFERVEQKEIPIFIHPAYVLGRDRLSSYYLSNLIGNPVDTSVAAACLAFGGVMERFPRLLIYLAHGGGATPFLCGRWQHGWEARPELHRLLKLGPMEYVRRFYFDSLTHSLPSLDLLVRTFGSDRVVLGSDYPFDMGDRTPVDSVKALGLSGEQQEQILGGNAAGLFRIGR